MIDLDAENWDEYLRDVYPDIQENLWEGPERILVFLPSDAKDETKEQEFKQRLLKDSREIIETLSRRGKLGTYKQSFKNDVMPLRILAYVPSGAAIYSVTVSPLLSIIPIAYVATVEGLAYRATKKDKERIIRNLGNLDNNVSVHYIKKL